MSIPLKRIARKNPMKPDEVARWYPVQNSTGMIDEDKVAELIADETTLNPVEALMAIRQLRKVAQRLLMDGHSVKLGNWGTFSVTLKTKGADKKEDVKVGNIEKVNVNFQAGEDLKTAMQKAEFIWIDKMVETTETCTPK